MTGPPTLPGLVLGNAAAMPRRPAFRHRKHGIWQTLTWSGFAALVRGFALGLAADGFGPGGRLAVLGENRPHLYAALLAAQSLGGAGLPLHPEADPDLIENLLTEAGASVVVADGRDQAEKLAALKERMPGLSIVVWGDTLGAQEPGRFRSFEAVTAAGMDAGNGRPGWFEAEAGQVAPEQAAILLPRPKKAGIAELSHTALLDAASTIAARETLRPTDEAFCYLPMCSLGDMVYSLALGLLCGFACNCPEAPHTVPRDLRAIGPTFLLATPHALELLAGHLAERSAALSGLKRLAFTHLRAAAMRAERLRAAGLPVPPALRLRCAVGDAVVDAPVRDLLGLRRTRFIHVGPGAPEPGVASLFRSLGIRLAPAPGIDPAELPAPRARELSHV